MDGCLGVTGSADTGRPGSCDAAENSTENASERERDGREDRGMKAKPLRIVVTK